VSIVIGTSNGDHCVVLCCSLSRISLLHLFSTKDERKVLTQGNFYNKFLHALAKLATAKGIELLSKCFKVQQFTAEQGVSAFFALYLSSYPGKVTVALYRVLEETGPTFLPKQR